MYWRWQNGDTTPDAATYPTQEQAREAACKSLGRIGNAAWERMDADKREVIWRLLERAGCRIVFAAEQ
ncbi:hypothetical protein BOO69_09635 [Sulfitobacter alexandrii]|uniref:Uncharacterized protein n=1 Tax=Sulfitobacter alexandrii TaxID=1917485 RepID=A0A1J0WHP3_9RHOB|nr:hypothetical protein [Sulfitobacter alexandrii]APE43646.1 hypothetical protein BOO69_09635 [Sulfitobacter alexandrii]